MWPLIVVYFPPCKPRSIVVSVFANVSYNYSSLLGPVFSPVLAEEIWYGVFKKSSLLS